MKKILLSKASTSANGYYNSIKGVADLDAGGSK